MIDPNLLPKRIRRCEVTDLVIFEEFADIRASLRALYETLLLICRRLPPAAVGADPADVLMVPPWYESPQTGNLIPFPAGIDTEYPGLGALRHKLGFMTEDQLAAFRAAQVRVAKHREALLQREKEREVRLKNKGLMHGPTM